MVPLMQWDADIIKCRDALSISSCEPDFWCLRPSSLMVTKHIRNLEHTFRDDNGQAWQPGRAMFEDHAIAREAIRNDFGLDIPSGSELAAWLPGTSSLWASTREREIVGFTIFLAKKLDHLDLVKRPPERRLVWDISRSLYNGRRELRAAPEGLEIPTILRNHKYFDTLLRREYLPLELLVVQGFPRDMCLTDLSMTQLADVAGNAMNVVVSAVFLGLILKNVNLTDRIAEVDYQSESSPAMSVHLLDNAIESMITDIVWSRAITRTLTIHDFARQVESSTGGAPPEQAEDKRSHLCFTAPRQTELVCD